MFCSRFPFIPIQLKCLCMLFPTYPWSRDKLSMTWVSHLFLDYHVQMSQLTCSIGYSIILTHLQRL
uniref:Uncharacterized protein n=1 Tax=Arundo donax TaxID=35708 RepID=A0A0A9BLH4_ARUDO